MTQTSTTPETQTPATGDYFIYTRPLDGGYAATLEQLEEPEDLDGTGSWTQLATGAGGTPRAALEDLARELDLSYPDMVAAFSVDGDA